MDGCFVRTWSADETASCLSSHSRPRRNAPALCLSLFIEVSRFDQNRGGRLRSVKLCYTLLPL